MEPLTMHDLTAAYALDALDAREAREYEDHLATCEQCRAELGQLSGAASALAFAVEAPAPAAELRGRILERAHAERPNVVPLRSRWTGPTQAVAAIAAVAAIGLGIWTIALSHSLDRERSARERAQHAINPVSDPNAKRLRVTGTSQGTVFVSPNGKAALVVSQLRHAPSGRTYEAWVIQNGMPVRAGTFAGGGNTVVGLERNVPAGAIVAVTLERKPGADTPHGKILMKSQTV